MKKSVKDMSYEEIIELMKSKSETDSVMDEQAMKKMKLAYAAIFDDYEDNEKDE